MANPKYADLPGIAYDQPDVYETTDLPESDQNDEILEDDIENECIERLHLSAKGAFSKFQGKSLGGNVDFSDRLSRKIRTGYDARSGDWELAAEGEEETPVEKFQRIRCEIAELLEQVTLLQQNAQDVDKGSYDDMVSQVSTTQRLMEGLKLEEKIGVNSIINASEIAKLRSQIEGFQKPSNESKLSGTPNKSRELPSLAANTRLADMEHRLYQLEAFLGDSTDKLARLTATTGCTTLVGAAQTLGTRAALLQPAQLDLIEARLGFIGGKMDAVVQQSGGSQNIERDQKIIELYEQVKKSEGLFQLIPQLLQRMQVLESLHKEASNFTKWLTELEALQNTITAGVQNNKALLQGVQEVFAQNLQNVTAEMNKIDGRINSLAKK